MIIRNSQRPKVRYLLISGFDSGHYRTNERPKIVLAEGNLYGERIIETVESLEHGTTYRMATERARQLSKDKGIVLGRNFPEDVWAVKVEAE